MEFSDLIRERFSVRKYRDAPIETEKLAAILEAGRIAPTGSNRQPQRIYVLKSPEALEKIRALTRCAFNAPVVLLVAVDEDEQWKNSMEEGFAAGEQDASIVAAHMMLAAWELGVGSCWVNWFPPTATARAFGLPENERAVLLLTLGYAADGVKPAHLHAEKKPMEALVREL